MTKPNETSNPLSSQATPLWLRSYEKAGICPQLPSQPYRSIAHMAQACSQTYSKQKAFTCVVPNGMNGSLRFGQVDSLSDAFAAYLREELKLPIGSRVAVQMPNCLAYPVVALGILKAACILVNTNPLYTEKEMVHQFKDSGAQALVIIDMFADKLPAVLPKTAVEHVVVAAITDFFPAVPKAVIRTVQKVWNQVLPPITVPHVRLKQAIAKGRSALGSASAQRYWDSLGLSDTAVLQYTGGTTGVSKGAVLSHGNLLTNVQQMLAMASSHLEAGKECVLTALPLYHIFAFTVNLLGFFQLGARNILIPSPRPVQNLQRAVENYPITWMTGVNTLYNALLNEEWFMAFPPKRLKASIAGGTALHLAVARRWSEVTRTPIAEGFGMTETSPVVSFNPLGPVAKPGSIGLPAPHTDVRIVQEDGRDASLGEPGELWVKGPQVMQGYWQNPEETAKTMHGEWLATGDIAVMDEEGYLKIVDRKKDMILVSGFNVYPNEVEDTISELDGVLEVAVIGIPDNDTGEAVRAYIVANPDAQEALSEQALIQTVLEHCRKTLTPYKVPKTVIVRADLPKTPVGKVLRKDLRQEILKGGADAR